MKTKKDCKKCFELHEELIAKTDIGATSKMPNKEVAFNKSNINGSRELDIIRERALECLDLFSRSREELLSTSESVYGQ